MDTYGIIGYPLEHSFSRSYFNEKFENEGIDAQYLNFEIANIAELPQILAEHPELKGFNVTSPYKEQVLLFLDEMDKDALAIGAVNVVKIVPQKGGNNKLVGYNSDCIGFTQSIEPLLEPHHKKALILGTGGASKAVIYGLKQLGLDCLSVSRRPYPNVIIYDELTSDVMRDYTVIVNCTPVGMYPQSEKCPNIPYQLLTPQHLLYDLIYNPDITLFMRKGMAMGATVKNGLEMLLLQAFAAWDIWNR